MPHNNSNFTIKRSSHPTFGDEQAGRDHLVLCFPSCLHFLPILLLTATAACGGGERPKINYTPVTAVAAPTDVAGANNGAIFQSAAYSPLTSGSKAARVGDIITIVLAERTNASKSNGATTGRDGSIGLTPPATGKLALFGPTDVNMSGSQSFKGQGKASQSNTLSGEITVTVAEILPNGVMRVRGEKLLTLNRGDESIQLTGLVRPADINSNNKVLSSRVADAQISYFGKGEIARASKQGWLQRFFSIISPF